MHCIHLCLFPTCMTACVDGLLRNWINRNVSWSLTLASNVSASCATLLIISVCEFYFQLLLYRLVSATSHSQSKSYLTYHTVLA